MSGTASSLRTRISFITFQASPTLSPTPSILPRCASALQWILDTAAANYDQQWLDYQYEIGLRHHRTAKNKTDKVESVDIINYRYLPALIYPVSATLKPFLANKGHAAAEVDKMHQAWIKSVLLQVILWTQPYVKDGDF